MEPPNDSSRQKQYVPSPRVIAQRAKDVRWLKSLGFNSRFICSVIQHNMPCVKVVEKMIQKYGTEETFYRLLPFLSDTEYDKECTDIWKQPEEEEKEEEEEEDYYDTSNDY